MNKKTDTLSVAEAQKEKAPRLSTRPPSNEKAPGCCMGAKDCAPPAGNVPQQSATPSALTVGSETKKGPKTRITVKFDVGFGNHLFLRGKGANLVWEKGVALKNVKHDEWVWETDLAFTSCEFKVLVNDKRYEVGDNHTLTCGASIQYTPRF